MSTPKDVSVLLKRIEMLKLQLQALKADYDPAIQVISESQRLIHEEFCHPKCLPLCIRSRRIVNLRGAM